MNITIKSQQKKPAMSREEVVAEVEFVGATTPKRDVMLEEFSKKLGKDKSTIAVKKIKTKFGSASANVLVYVYDSADDLKKIEPQEKKAAKPAEGAAAPAGEAQA